MTKEEIDLLSKIVMACKGALGMQAGMLPQIRNELFAQMDDLDKALAAVKDTANASAQGCEAYPAASGSAGGGK